MTVHISTILDRLVEPPSLISIWLTNTHWMVVTYDSHGKRCQAHQVRSLQGIYSQKVGFPKLVMGPGVWSSFAPTEKWIYTIVRVLGLSLYSRDLQLIAIFSVY